MELPEIAREASRKGVKIMGTGDCLFPKWLDEIKKLPENDGLFILDDMLFALTVEVEDPIACIISFCFRKHPRQRS